MGVMEIQVFVSLVVVLGAAFAALLCDFLKGNNERLRESNIVLRVQRDERDKRDELVEQVQRRTIEAVAQAQRIAAARPAAMTTRPLYASEARPQPSATDPRELFERAQAERSARGRRAARHAESSIHPMGDFAQTRSQSMDPQTTVPAEVQPVVEPAAPVRAITQEQLEVRPLAAQPMMQQPVLEPASAIQDAPLPRMQAQPAAPSPLQAAQATLAVSPLASAPAPVLDSSPVPAIAPATMPQSELRAEVPAYDFAPPVASSVATEEAGPVPEIVAEPAEELVEAALPPDPEAPVVRIRVLQEEEVVPEADSIELTLPADQVSGQPVAAEPAVADLTPLPLPSVPAGAQPAMAPQATPEFAPVAAGMPPARLSPQEPEPELPAVSAEPAFAPRVLKTEPRSAEPRSNVVQMPVSPSSRYAGPEPLTDAELVLPGGFHEPTVLARLLEDETPFTGLAIAISVVDYVRLMADQGKPIVEQLMAAVMRLAMSFTREADFGCRIAEDEFILLFGGESGTAAKRRIQQISERLWDFQLRALGTVSIVFTWGAAESQSKPLVQSVEQAREQMLDTRRSRRSLAEGAPRFRRRVANS